MLKATIREFDLNSADGRINAARAAAPALAKVRDRALRDEYLRLLSGWLGLEVAQVSGLIKGVGVGNANNPSVGRDVNVGAAIEREALKAMIQFPDYVGDYISEVDASLFTSDVPAQLGVAVRKEFEERKGSDLSPWAEGVQARLGSPELVSVFKNLYAEPMQGDISSSRYCRAVVARLLEARTAREIDELRGRLKRAETAGDSQDEARIFGELLEAENRRRLLRSDAQGAA